MIFQSGKIYSLFIFLKKLLNSSDKLFCVCYLLLRIFF